MKKLFMFFGAISVLLGFSSCKKDCACTVRYDGYTYTLGRFVDYTKKECDKKEKEFKYYFIEYPTAQVTCTRE